MSRTMSHKALLAFAALVAASDLTAAPALAQSVSTSATNPPTSPDQKAMTHSSVERSMLGMPIVQPDGTLIGWLTGARMTNADPNLVLIERPSRGADKEVLAIDGSPLRVRGDTIVLDTQVAARPATYGLDGAVVD